MKAIIFGAGGQDGIYLTELLKRNHIEVIGITRSVGEWQVDITSFEEVCNFIKTTLPRYIFHLAASSTTRIEAWQHNHATISTGALNLLEAVRQFSPDTKIFLSGSGLQFQNKGLAIKETDPFEATSMYAVSRIHTSYAARYYRSLGIKAYVGYFFNHDSEYRSERHINKKITETVKRIANGSTEKLSIGDLSVKKEFGFAGDIVSAVFTLVQQDDVYESVIGTGVAHAIEEWVSTCFAMYGLRWQDHVEQLTGFSSEYRVLVSDPTTIFSLGWRPATDIQTLAKIMSA